jgi:hypothetical protein
MGSLLSHFHVPPMMKNNFLALKETLFIKSSCCPGTDTISYPPPVGQRDLPPLQPVTLLRREEVPKCRENASDLLCIPSGQEYKLGSIPRI